MMDDAVLIAIDWGTSNRRVYRLGGDGAVIASDRDDRGMLAMIGGDYAAEVAAIRARHGDLPVLIAGMAGSNRGWRETSYRACPAGVDDLARAICWIEPGRTGIVPGVSVTDGTRADVMRGEEVQLLGAIVAGMAEPDSLLCQPGTHCKWVDMRGGRIADFTTAMTGEMFALLKNHSILKGQLDGEIVDGEAFRAGIADARAGDLLARLFGIRAAMLLGTRADADSAAYASGLIIGADVAARRLDPVVGVLADPALGALYSAAIAGNGGTAILLDSQAAFVAGINALWSRL